MVNFFSRLHPPKNIKRMKQNKKKKKLFEYKIRVLLKNLYYRFAYISNLNELQYSVYKQTVFNVGGIRTALKKLKMAKKQQKKPRTRA